MGGMLRPDDTLPEVDSEEKSLHNAENNGNDSIRAAMISMVNTGEDCFNRQRFSTEKATALQDDIEIHFVRQDSGNFPNEIVDDIDEDIDESNANLSNEDARAGAVIASSPAFSHNTL